MSIEEAYNTWSSQYDINENKTRDLEANAIRETLHTVSFQTCLEIGCGTGKNTEWLLTRTERLHAVDFSGRMLEKAKEKIVSDRVTFIRADITGDWSFASGPYDLITFSLVLEHIENLEYIFREASKLVTEGGYVYIGELHPYKQYQGTKARFETEEGSRVLTCYTHNISDFTQLALKYGFTVENLNEYFDDAGTQSVPRIFTLLLRKR
jgi:predicted TPR repeat methyltransferase